MSDAGERIDPGRAARPPREAGIEWLRLGACAAIVAFHANPARWPLMISGLEVFTIFTVALSVRSAGRRGIGDFVRIRAETLLVPWVVWWLLYAAWKTWLCGRGDRPVFVWFEAWRLLAGPETHLWFLPFAFVVTVAAGWWFGSHAGAKDVRRARRDALAWSVVAAALIVGASFAMAWFEDLRAREGRELQPLRQWVTALPGVAIGLAIVRSRVGGVYDGVAIGVMWGVCVAAAVASYVLGWTNITAPYVIAVSASVVGLSVRHAAGPALSAMVSLTFGIFLVHLAVIDVWYFAMARLGVRDALGPDEGMLNALCRTAAVLGVSAAGVWALRRTPARRVL